MGNTNKKLFLVNQDNELTPADLNEKEVKRVLKFNEHPNPLIVISYIVIVICIMYYTYILFVKKSLTGEWYDYSKERIDILHNKWNDVLVITYKNSNKVIYGKVCGKGVKINFNGDKTRLGVFHEEKIYWAGSDDVWKQFKYLV